jgi:hypothetical protein
MNLRWEDNFKNNLYWGEKFNITVNDAVSISNKTVYSESELQQQKKTRLTNMMKLWDTLINHFIMKVKW